MGRRQLSKSHAQITVTLTLRKFASKRIPSSANSEWQLARSDVLNEVLLPVGAGPPQVPRHHKSLDLMAKPASIRHNLDNFLGFLKCNVDTCASHALVVVERILDLARSAKLHPSAQASRKQHRVFKHDTGAFALRWHGVCRIAHQHRPLRRPLAALGQREDGPEVEVLRRLDEPRNDGNGRIPEAVLDVRSNLLHVSTRRFPSLP